MTQGQLYVAQMRAHFAIVTDPTLPRCPGEASRRARQLAHLPQRVGQPAQERLIK